MPYILLKKNKEGRILAGHPWIYQGEVNKIRGVFNDGDIVGVKDYKERFLGQGFVNRNSQIIVRLITDRKEAIGKDFFKKRIESAIEYRDRFIVDTDAKRIIFSEGDFLPGLIVDYYNGHMVIQTLTLGMDKRKDIIVEILKEIFNPKAIYERNDVPVRGLEGLSQRKGLICGDTQTEILCNINGVKFFIDIQNGQKTGFYLDQRENYNVLGDLVKDKTVLDCFCYTGGFGITAACFGAKQSLGIDISNSAIETAKRNAEINNVSNICTWDVGNVFDILKEKTKKKEFYDVVILDPPSFTKAKDSISNAIRGYKEINLRALQLIPQGGYLVTCCCSFHISRDLFKGVITDAAKDAKRKLRLVEYRTQSRDHPILPAVPETEYLKCFILQVL